MTLHEAIIKALKQQGKTMSTQEIANELNENKWYTKKDGSSITAFQIHGRTRNYSHLFNRHGSKVSLNNNLAQAPSVAKVASFAQVASFAKVAPSPSRPIAQVAQVPSVALQALMNEKNFKPAGTIDQLVPAQPGLYCIRIDKPENLPEPFSTHLKNRNHNIIYIGIATKNLNKRLLNQELRGKGHGTFFRGLGALLGYRPPAGSLVNRKNKNNYKFSPADQKSIISWINQHLLVNWVIFEGDFNNAETNLLQQYLPLMNTINNPLQLYELAALRKVCRQIAST